MPSDGGRRSGKPSRDSGDGAGRGGRSSARPEQDGRDLPSRPRTVPARPAIVDAGGRSSLLGRIAKIFLFFGLLAVIYVQVNHYLKEGSLLDPTSAEGKDYIRKVGVQANSDFNASLGYVKGKLPGTKAELRAWLAERGLEPPSTGDLLARANKIVNSPLLDPKGGPDSRTAVEVLVRDGGSVNISDAERNAFELAQEDRALRRKRARERREFMERVAVALAEAEAEEVPSPPSSGQPQPPGDVPAEAPVEAPVPGLPEESPIERPEEVEVASTPEPKAFVADEPSAEEVPPAAASRPERIDSDLEEGMRYHLEAMKHFRNTDGSSPNFQAELQASRKLFRKAQQHLEAASARDPSNRKIEELARQNNMFLYDCMKRTTLVR